MKKLSLTLCSLLVLGCLVSPVPSSAQPNLPKQLIQTLETSVIPNFAIQRLIDWKVGDEANFVIKAGFFGEVGRMKKFVHSEVGNSIWLHTEITGQMNKVVKAKINRDTGEVEEYIEDGQAKTPPDSSLEVIDQADGGEITVPAGTFHTVYIKAKSTTNGREQVLELWLNQRDTTMEGMVQLKTKASGFKITLSLVSFTKIK